MIFDSRGQIGKHSCQDYYYPHISFPSWLKQSCSDWSSWGIFSPKRKKGFVTQDPNIRKDFFLSDSFLCFGDHCNSRWHLIFILFSLSTLFFFRTNETSTKKRKKNNMSGEVLHTWLTIMTWGRTSDWPDKNMSRHLLVWHPWHGEKMLKDLDLWLVFDDSW